MVKIQTYEGIKAFGKVGNQVYLLILSIACIADPDLAF
jgi:hypothetical protein